MSERQREMDVGCNACSRLKELLASARSVSDQRMHELIALRGMYDHITGEYYRLALQRFEELANADAISRRGS